MSGRAVWRASGIPDGARGVVVRFARSRTFVHFVRLDVTVEGAEPFVQRTRPVGSTACMDWDGHQVPTGPVELAVAYEGDVPVPVHVTWIGQPSEELLPEFLPGWTMHLEAPSRGVARELWHKERQKVSIPQSFEESVVDAPTLSDASDPRVEGEQLFAARKAALEDDWAIRRFFLELDTRTSPGVVDGAWARDLQAVRRRLHSRGSVRIRRGADLRVPVFSKEHEVLGERPALERVSTFFIEVAREHLELEGGRNLLGWAFEQFATDAMPTRAEDPELQRDLYSHGTPNGSEFFKFAELALMCLDNDVDAEFWNANVEALVRVSHVFVEHSTDPARLRVAPRRPEDFGHRPGRVYPDQRLWELRRQYAERLAGRDGTERKHRLEARFTSLMSQALLRNGGVSGGHGLRHLEQADRLELLPGGRRPPIQERSLRPPPGRDSSTGDAAASPDARTRRSSGTRPPE